MSLAALTPRILTELPCGHTVVSAKYSWTVVDSNTSSDRRTHTDPSRPGSEPRTCVRVDFMQRVDLLRFQLRENRLRAVGTWRHGPKHFGAYPGEALIG